MTAPRASPFDALFARFLEGFAAGDLRLFAPGADARPPDSPLFHLAARALCAALREGHVCLDLARPLPAAALSGDQPPPARERILAALEAHPLVGRPGETAPLVLDARDRLYLHRYHRNEQDLAADLRARAARFTPAGSIPGLRAAVERFGDGADPSQRLAMVTALLHGFCVISGGPGTGKTTTAARILALCAALSPPGRPPLIRLAAPTGKAAARLSEAIRQAAGRLDLPPALATLLPREASTLHRLLEPVERTHRFRRHAGNPLAADLLIVDEASMVPLSLMRRLVDALPPGAKLVLLGDMDQLASVEPGRVLGDLCAPGRAAVRSSRFVDSLRGVFPEFLRDVPSADGFRLHDAIVRLEVNHRSDRAVADAARRLHEAGTEEEADLLLDDLERADGAVRFRPLPAPRRLLAALEPALEPSLRALREAATPAGALERLGDFRLLAAARSGPYGVERLNALVEASLLQRDLIDPRNPWYDHRPVMVTENDYGLSLFNGDIGVLRDGRAHFPAAAGSRDLPPSLLSACETVYAMTVHKSQGSEFDRVLLVLPDRYLDGLTTKELIYTALTRARRGVEILGPRDVARRAIVRRIERSSGLRDALFPEG